MKRTELRQMIQEEYRKVIQEETKSGALIEEFHKFYELFVQYERALDEFERHAPETTELRKALRAMNAAQKKVVPEFNKVQKAMDGVIKYHNDRGRRD